jgi:hypothetical protein
MAANAQAIKSMLRTNLLYARNNTPDKQNVASHEAMEKAIEALCDAMISLEQELAEIKRLTNRPRPLTGRWPIPPKQS